MRKKIILFILLTLFFTFFIPFQINNCFSKYVIEKTFNIATVNTDDTPPDFELVSIINTNTNYESYANSKHQITVQIKLIEKNIKTNNFNQNNLKVKVGDSFVSPNFERFDLISENSNEKIYEITLTNLSGNGSLKLFIPAEVVTDISDLKNVSKTFDTGITIDNIAPTLTFTEETSDNNNSLITINSSEKIRPLENWQISTDKTKISKTFYNKISYPITLTDFAQNSSEILISATKATNISLLYTTYDSYSIFSNSSNGDIAGTNTISSDVTNKTECLLVYLETSSVGLELQGRCFLYTHWGDGSIGICKYSELKYYYGYNPSKNSWRNVNTDNLAMLNGNFHTQFGGTGINYPNAIDTSGKNPIPTEIANQNLYGISVITFRLTDSSQFSVVYQTYIKNEGWQKTCSDGEESMLQFNKPISGIRINIVPKTDKQYLINYWNRDVGTNNVD